ncbi:MAG: hypothetical protein AAFP04_03720 [Myxococcota bacterium]
MTDFGPTQFAIADSSGTVRTQPHRDALAAWRELIPNLPLDPDQARSATLIWVGRGFRVVNLTEPRLTP